MPQRKRFKDYFARGRLGGRWTIGSGSCGFGPRPTGEWMTAKTDQGDRGYIDWTPRSDSKQAVEDILSVLDLRRTGRQSRMNAPTYGQLFRSSAMTSSAAAGPGSYGVPVLN